MTQQNMPRLNVFLTKSEMENIPEYTLPDGYTFSDYESGVELDWVKLNMMYDQFESFAQAIQYFQTVFQVKPEEINHHVMFVRDPHNQLVGTAALFHGTHFGSPMTRIHFLAVSPFHRQKGIAKAMLSRLLKIHAELRPNQSIYIASTTLNYREIHIYEQFGFSPYLTEKPPAFPGTEQQFHINKVIAWDLIHEEIRKYNIAKSI